MTPTFTARMQNRAFMSFMTDRKRSLRSVYLRIDRGRCGFTLAESMVVIVMLSLMIVLTAVNLKGVIIKNSFKSNVRGLISTLEAASNSGSQSDKRYEVIIDIPQQSYMLREITSPDLSEVLEEEIIIEEYFSE